MLTYLHRMHQILRGCIAELSISFTRWTTYLLKESNLEGTYLCRKARSRENRFLVELSSALFVWSLHECPIVLWSVVSRFKGVKLSRNAVSVLMGDLAVPIPG